jgi:hypothetical protein
MGGLNLVRRGSRWGLQRGSFVLCIAAVLTMDMDDQATEGWVIAVDVDASLEDETETERQSADRTNWSRRQNTRSHL